MSRGPMSEVADLLLEYEAKMQVMVDALAMTEAYLMKRIDPCGSSTGATKVLPALRKAIEGSPVKPAPTSWGDIL